MRYLFLFLLLSNPAVAEIEKAIFAGGCFWCVEADFDKLPGVIETISGYDGGIEKNPSYKLVSSGKTNYVESVLVIYDNKKLSYKKLLDYYWHHIDPVAQNSQFCDHGRQYRSVIFYLNESQRHEAILSRSNLQTKFPIIYTDIIPSTSFYKAEEYHQKYYKKNKLRYKLYRKLCGRDARIMEIWNEKIN